jgi:HSP20 family protein
MSHLTPLVRFSQDPFDDMLSMLLNRYPFRQQNVHDSQANQENALSQMTAHSELKELDDHYELVVAMPGVAKENVNISVENGVLTVSGRTVQEESGDEEGRHWSKMMRSSYQRSFTLPKGTSSEHLDARMENGVLHLNIQKHQVQSPDSFTVNVN